MTDDTSPGQEGHRFLSIRRHPCYDIPTRALSVKHEEFVGLVALAPYAPCLRSMAALFWKHEQPYVLMHPSRTSAYSENKSTRLSRFPQKSPIQVIVCPPHPKALKNPRIDISYGDLSSFINSAGTQISRIFLFLEWYR